MTMADSDDPAFLAPDETRLTRLSCPECHGSLAQVDLPRISYYRCHTGHAWGPQSLAAAQSEASESALWAAVAALDEEAALGRHLAALQAVADHQPDRRSDRRATALAALLREHLGAPRDGSGYPAAPSSSSRSSALNSAGGAAEGLAKAP